MRFFPPFSFRGSALLSPPSTLQCSDSCLSLLHASSRFRDVDSGLMGVSIVEFGCKGGSRALFSSVLLASPLCTGRGHC